MAAESEEKDDVREITLQTLRSVKEGQEVLKPFEQSHRGERLRSGRSRRGTLSHSGSIVQSKVQGGRRHPSPPCPSEQAGVSC